MVFPLPITMSGGVGIDCMRIAAASLIAYSAIAIVVAMKMYERETVV